ncbi:MAG: DUF1804 family protein [Deltaproteobacteria bacterium]|nr:DUF1804 family protein [Deltaproteobacteria bacterium]
MAAKPDISALRPEARRLYVQGSSIKAVASTLGVSPSTVSRWKAESSPGGKKPDGWDLARRDRRSVAERVADLFEEALAFTEAAPPAERKAHLDHLIKIGGLLEKLDKAEQARQVADSVEQTVRRAGLSEEYAEKIRARILGMGG